MEEIDIASIKKRSIQGVFALVSRTFLLNVISYATSLVIFSFLAPSEFGIYLAATAGQRIISFFTDFGLGAALIQKKDKLTQDDLTTTFTIQSVVTISIFILVFLLQGYISSFLRFGEIASQLFVVLVFSIFLSSFKIIPSILLERKIYFQKLIIPQIAEVLVFNFLLIALLFQGKGLTSYIWAFLISGLVSIPVYYFVSPWKIRIGISRKSLSHLKYGIQFQAKNVLATIKDDVLMIFLVKVLSFTDVGYIGFGQRNAFFAYRTIVDNISKVTFSTYSRVQDNMEFLRKMIEKSLFLVSSAMFPLLLGLIMTGPFFIQHFPRWQNKWEPAIISLTFFALNALVSSLSGILVNVLDATGRVGTTLRLMVIWTALTWILTPILIYLYGYNGVSVASFVVTLTIFYTIYLVRKIVYFDLLGSIYKPFLSSLFMVIIVYIGQRIFVNNLYTLILDIVIGGVTYTAFLYLLAREEINKDIRKVFVKA